MDNNIDKRTKSNVDKRTKGEWKMRRVNDVEFSYQIETSLKDIDAIACVYGIFKPIQETEANAAFICKAVNNHDTLVNILKRVNEICYGAEIFSAEFDQEIKAAIQKAEE